MQIAGRNSMRKMRKAYKPPVERKEILFFFLLRVRHATKEKREKGEGGGGAHRQEASLPRL